MELVNKDFAKISKVDLLCIASLDFSKSGVVSNLLNSIIQHEKMTNDYIGEFYISTSGLYYHELDCIQKFVVSRKTLLNAFIYAGYNYDLNVIFKLQPFILKKQVYLEELGALSDYVMKHSIDFDEFCDGQEPKLIFDENDNVFKKDLIYKSDGKKFLK